MYVDEGEDGEERDVSRGEERVREVGGERGAEEDLKASEEGDGDGCEKKGHEGCLSASASVHIEKYAVMGESYQYPRSKDPIRFFCSIELDLLHNLRVTSHCW